MRMLMACLECSRLKVNMKNKDIITPGDLEAAIRETFEHQPLPVRARARTRCTHDRKPITTMCRVGTGENPVCRCDVRLQISLRTVR